MKTRLSCLLVTVLVANSSFSQDFGSIAEFDFEDASTVVDPAPIIPMFVTESVTIDPKTGKEVIVTQEKVPNFTFVGGVSAPYSSNAFSNFTEESDWAIGFSAGIKPKAIALGDDLALSTSFGAGWMRFDRFGTDLDHDVLSPSVSLTKTIDDNTSLTLAEKSIWIFSPGFDDNGLTKHTASLGIAKNLGKDSEDDPSFFSLGLRGERTWADPSNQDRSKGVFEFAWTQKGVKLVGDKDWNLVIGTEVAYADYDNFLAAPAAEDRQFWHVGASVALSCKLTENLQLKSTISYLHSDDTITDISAGGARFDRFDYDSFGWTPTLELTLAW